MKHIFSHLGFNDSVRSFVPALELSSSHGLHVSISLLQAGEVFGRTISTACYIMPHAHLMGSTLLTVVDIGRLWMLGSFAICLICRRDELFAVAVPIRE